MNAEPKRPYYDPAVLANKRSAETSRILEALKATFPFGGAWIINNDKSITSISISTQKNKT